MTKEENKTLITPQLSAFENRYLKKEEAEQLYITREEVELLLNVMKEENNKYLLLEAEKKSIDLFEPQLNEMALDLNTRFQAI